jgi:hypothetical protein
MIDRNLQLARQTQLTETHTQKRTHYFFAPKTKLYLWH